MGAVVVVERLWGGLAGLWSLRSVRILVWLLNLVRGGVCGAVAQGR